MSDRKTGITPIIVGSVIALLGILTGLYIATNAHEQLQAQTSDGGLQTSDGGVQTSDGGLQTLDEGQTDGLPDLPAVDDTPAPLAEEPVEPAEPVVDASVQIPADADAGEPDDFVPVSPEEIEQAIPQQDNNSQDSIL